MIQFNEVQRFRIKWAWAGVIALNGLFLYAIFQQLILGKPFGTKPAPDFALVLIELFFLLLVLLLLSIRLKTVYNNEGISYRFSPFQLKTSFISWTELRDAYLREYNSLYEYGGWGIRFGGSRHGKAVNTSESCNKGLQLQFTDGRLLLIGTKNPAAIQQVLDAVQASGKINRGI